MKLTQVDEATFQQADECHICNKKYTDKDKYVKDKTTTTMILNVTRDENSEKISESQMGFEPTTLRDTIWDSIFFFRVFISPYI